MSKRLQKEKHFLELLLTTDKHQVKALMESLTASQVEVLVEIFINLLHINTPKKTKDLLRRRQRLIKKLTSRQLTIATKYRTIRQHMRQVYDTLLSVKGKLLQLLRCL